MTSTRADPEPQASTPDGQDVSDNFKIALYNTARQELIERIKLRDGALLGYITIVGTTFGITIANKVGSQFDFDGYLINLAIPFLCVIFTLVILQHHIVIGKLAAFTQKEMGFSKSVRHFDNSDALHKSKDHLNLRTYAQALLLVFPIIANAAFLWKSKYIISGIHLIPFAIIIFPKSHTS
jgi:hypothetical protein